ncbi:alpha/beta fold hydrolase [Nocardia sp. NPDC052254]|uniref:alpha/beta hydrolase family protein n=1 Tax=Nocardia sp. NPDC052254 TaxID=3155681 RepID=UPI0034268C5A
MTMTTAEETGIEVVELLRANGFTHVHEKFAAHLRALVSAENLRDAWDSVQRRHGRVTEVGEAVGEAGPADVTTVRIPIDLERGKLLIELVIDDSGRLTGLQLTPPTEPWRPPDHVDETAFDEQDVTLGTDPYTVSGTLTTPRQSTGCPAVVLLAGGGPFDRDGTAGSNKPLKDLAWGLAGRGIAVLRFDKITHTHRNAVSHVDGFTMTDEYVPQTVAAVGVLRAHPAVDAERVFLLGHSMGGKVAPRVAAAEPAIAGMILMAADAEPMHRAAVRVTRYLAALSPGGEAAARSAIETLTRQAELVDAPELSPATPAGDLPLGLSAAYWLDLRDYDPVATAAAVGKPMLILQGGRDYQVTVDDDLARWRAGLEGCRGVTIRVYDADNHLFFPGTGPSTPAEYAAPQHVDPQVVTDIATWLTTNSPGRPTRTCSDADLLARSGGPGSTALDPTAERPEA